MYDQLVVVVELAAQEAGKVIIEEAASEAEEIIEKDASEAEEIIEKAK